MTLEDRIRIALGTQAFDLICAQHQIEELQRAMAEAKAKAENTAHDEAATA